MARFKYHGPDKDIGRFGPVGHGSILELSVAEANAIDGTLFERVSDSTPSNILPFGTIPYVPDVTGLTTEEAAKVSIANPSVTSASMEAAGGTPGPRDKHGKTLTAKEQASERRETAKDASDEAAEKKRLEDKAKAEQKSHFGGSHNR
jgi:hypothetical protein